MRDLPEARHERHGDAFTRSAGDVLAPVEAEIRARVERDRSGRVRPDPARARMTGADRGELERGTALDPHGQSLRNGAPNLEGCE